MGVWVRAQKKMRVCADKGACKQLVKHSIEYSAGYMFDVQILHQVIH